MEFDPVPYDVQAATLSWLMVLGIVLISGLVVACLISVAGYGLRGFGKAFQGLLDGVIDLLHTSPRRVWGLSILTFKESVRRKTLLVIVVFAVLFLFAGWFLPSSTTDPDFQLKVYVSFVLKAISLLILPTVFLLACWGLPEDIKARSLHTVVTKPVRRHEVILGRVFGITLVGTGVLIAMSLAGYVWLHRALFQTLPPEKLVARVPVYGSIAFTNREGQPAATGINTGDVWMFRSYIDGNTKARAIWEFQGVTPARFGDQLTLETTIQVFRSYKGDLESGVLCQYVFVNPKSGIRAAYDAFPIVEFHENVQKIDRKALRDEQNRPVDLYNDLAPDGKLRIEVFCLTGGQYLGMARPDLFIRARDASLSASFFKSVLGIWEMMLMLIAVGVTASTVLKGPIATLLTFVFLVLGQVAYTFLHQLTDDKIPGGGPLESVYRLVTGMNQQLPLPKSPLISVVEGIDWASVKFLWALRHIVPNFEYYNLATYTANGFDVPWEAALLPGLLITFGYILPCLVLGYFCLKTRELESK